MAGFSFKTNIGDDRTARITTTFPVAVPEIGAAQGDPYPLDTALEIWFTGKKLKSDPDENAIISKTLSDGDISVEDNIARVTVFRADLASVRPIASDMQLYCDVQVKDAAGKVVTVAEGKWKFTPEITQGA